MPPVSELSHPIRLDRIGGASIKVSLRPESTVRSALAERFGLQSIDAFGVEFTVRRLRASGWIEVSGSVSATVVQTCIVTTDPVPATVKAEVMELFDDSGAVSPDEVDLDPLADTPEPIDGDALDVGEIAAQAFGLALDPYPRAAGVDPEAALSETTGPETAASPFAKLAVLQGRNVKKG